MKRRKKPKIGTVPMPKVTVGPDWRDWRWDILPQEGMVHLAIYRVTMGDKAFLAYSGIGTADFSRATHLTQAAMGIMTRLSKDKPIWLDIRQRVEVEWRVVSAFHGVKIYFIDSGDRRQGAQERPGGQRAPQTLQIPSQPQRGGFHGQGQRVPDHQALLDYENAPEWAR
jgi:hypothetical protein